MKKHIVLIMNMVLAAVIVGAIAFTIMHALSSDKAPAEPADETTAPAVTEASTEAVTLPAGERYKVGIIQHSTKADSDSCYAGFISQLNDRGLLSNIDIVYVVEENDDKCKEEISRLVDEGCDLLYTVGPFASKAAAKITDEIPIVFAMVSDPEEAGLVESNEEPGGSITGVSSYTPCFEQIDLIPLLLPDAKRVAAIYSSTDENAVRQAIIAVWESEDYHYTADRYPVNSADDLKEATAKIKKEKTDVIYLPIDSFISEHLDSIVSFADKNGIPIICGNEKMMRRGCLATCEINYTSIGRRCADLSYDILFGKKDPASLPVIYKYDCYNLVNRQVADKLGLKLSEVALQNVEMVDYEKKE